MAAQNVVVEPDVCTVCRDRYTASIRKKISCKYCHASACSKCIEQYLLTRHEDAHCLHCRVNYNDTSLLEICTKTYLQHTYFKHRQEVLINRERANLPALQERALQVKRQRELDHQIAVVHQEIREIKADRDQKLGEYTTLYREYYHQHRDDKARYLQVNELLDRIEERREAIHLKKQLIHELTWGQRTWRPRLDDEKEEEKKKFIRRCTRDGCQGFLSTAWKCGLCEWYSCCHCFLVKGKEHDAEHECKKEDVETAELIKKDCKPCPKCGEFIQKSSGCDQMFCISCQTPFSWASGKIVTSGPIHNPHYYEWMKRTGGAVPRNPTDVPCGGFPGGWELVGVPRGVKRETSMLFTEFHRMCMELQDISTRQFRSHIEQAPLNDLNVRFLLSEMEEKKWGQQLAVLEKKRKRDAEIQEVLGAFRMVAVELINRIQHFQDGPIRRFDHLPSPAAEKYLLEWNVQAMELVNMINDAMRNISSNYSYAVPYLICDLSNRRHYGVEIKNLVLEDKKKRAAKKAAESAISEAKSEAKSEIEPVAPVAPVPAAEPIQRIRPRIVTTEMEQLQEAIAASLRE